MKIKSNGDWFQIGIFIVYFLDNILGSGWWVMVLHLVLLFAVMVVRGKPYGAEQIVSTLFPKKACCSSWIGPLLAFTWNVVSDRGQLVSSPGRLFSQIIVKKTSTSYFHWLLLCLVLVDLTPTVTGSYQSQHSRNFSHNCFIARPMVDTNCCYRSCR